MTIISIFKSIKSNLNPKNRKSSQRDQHHAETKSYVEPLDDPPPLNVVTFPRVQLDHRSALFEQGWTTVGLSEIPADKLYIAYQNLLEASQAFFKLPESYKQSFKTQQGSEEGWSRVEGEKEFITLRTIDNTPVELKAAASTYWREAAGLLNETLGRVAESLGLPADSLTVFSEPCTALGDSETATMLRLFRYDGFEGNQSKVVAEAHADLGLLSLVIGNKPGLEVKDFRAQCWFPIEQSYQSTKGSLLVGRQLERLSNGRYRAGGHRVKSYPDSTPEPKISTSKDPYRYSIVFVLRAHSPVPVNTDSLTTGITGPFADPLRDITVGKLFRQIRAAHFNINTEKEEREEQRQKLAEMQRKRAVAEQEARDGVMESRPTHVAPSLSRA